MLGSILLTGHQQGPGFLQRSRVRSRQRSEDPPRHGRHGPDQDVRASGEGRGRGHDRRRRLPLDGGAADPRQLHRGVRPQLGLSRDPAQRLQEGAQQEPRHALQGRKELPPQGASQQRRH